MSQKVTLTAIIVAHNEQERLPSCLEKLKFADELIVVLDKCNDNSKNIALDFGAKIIEGAWDIEGLRRNIGLNAAACDWTLEVDADEHISPELALEILKVINSPENYDYFEIKFNNYIGNRALKYGVGANFTAGSSPRLSKKGIKKYSETMHVHPSITWAKNAKKGYKLNTPAEHFMDRNLFDTLKRLNSYTEAKAIDLKNSNKKDSLINNIRRFFSRFFKCFVSRKGYKEGELGFFIALCAGLFPLISYLKAKIENDRKA